MSNVTGTVPAHPHIQNWVKSVAAMCQPDSVYWCDGSEQEKEQLIKIAVQCGDLIPLNQKEAPGCYLHRSALNDVARTENLTFVCTEQQEEAGPNNNWMAPAESYDKLGKIFAGAMRGRTLYVIPFLMGPQGSSFSKVGVQVTDSVYVVLNMRLMTRMGKIALDHLGNSDDFTRCLHSKARSRYGAALYLSFSAGQHRVERRLGIRRQRARARFRSVSVFPTSIRSMRATIASGDLARVRYGERRGALLWF